MGWAAHVAFTENKRRAERVSMGTRGEKRLFAVPRRRWEDNIKMYLKEIEWGPCTELIWIWRGTNGGLL